MSLESTPDVTAQDSSGNIIPDRDNKFSQSLVYLVSPRGGNNFWARLLNGCDKTFAAGEIKTLGVRIADNGRFVLAVNYDFFSGLSERMQKLVLVHEAGHIALRHHERFMRVLSQSTDPQVRMAVHAVWNVAVDLATNDQVVRKEAEFQEAWDAGEFKGSVWPEYYNLPKDKTAEQYATLLIRQLPETLKQMMKQLQQMEEQGDQDGQGQDGEEGQEGSGGGGESDAQSSKSGKSGESKGKGKGKGQQGKTARGNSAEADGDIDPENSFIESSLEKMAKQRPELFKKLLEAHQQMTGGSHKAWEDMADKLSPDQALSMANKMKNHARQLAKTAHDQTARARGFLPAHIQNIIGPLLEAEQVPWNWFFRDSVAGAICSKIIPEMSSPNMGLLAESDWVEPWPGNSLDVEFNVHFLVDTSGSVNDKEFARAWNELLGLRKVTKNLHITVIQNDTHINKVEDFDNAQLPEPGRQGFNRYGYGGTIYTPAFKLMCGVDEPGDWANPPDKEKYEHKNPDLVIVYTDGGVVIEGEVFPRYRPPCGVIWLVAPGCSPVPGMSDNGSDRVIQMFGINDYDT